MADAQASIKVEVRAYGLWRLKVLSLWARYFPVPTWLVRLVVASAGVKTRVHGRRRRWERTPFRWVANG